MEKSQDDDEKIIKSIGNILSLPKESDDGNVEYKQQLINLTPERIEGLITQMSYRLNEGGGEAIYEIGYTDDGFPKGLSKEKLDESINNLVKIANNINAKIMKIMEKEVSPNKYVSEVLVRENYDRNHKYIDLTIVVAGNVDASKSSTIGVLTTGILDDGKGLARSHVCNFKHELETGRTSSIAKHILGFRSDGTIVNDNLKSKLSWPDIVGESSKIITFNDLAGHERYLRTTIRGFSSMYADYCMIVMDGLRGFTHMTKEHLGLALSFKIPFYIVVSKIDITPQHIREDLREKINSLMKQPGLRKIPIWIKNDDDICTAANKINTGACVPIFEISNVTGENIDSLRKFLNLLPTKKNYEIQVNEHVEFIIDEKFTVPGAGTVVSGQLLQGKVRKNDVVMIGPDGNGNFKKTQIKSIHFKQILVEEAEAGHFFCFAIKNVNKSWIRRGMVIVSAQGITNATNEFEAEVNILTNHHTTIRIGYEPCIHINNIAQPCKIMSIEKIKSGKKNNEEEEEVEEGRVILRPGDKANIHFKFKVKPEYIREGLRIIFRENKVRGIGIIKRIIC
jgi:GTPase